MKSYNYLHPNTINETPILVIQNEQKEDVLTCQRIYSNGVKRFLDQLLWENKYFLTYKTYDLKKQELFTCKKISRKGKMYFEVVDERNKEKYSIAYDGWQQLIPNLIITKGDFLMKIHKEMEDWSTFLVDDRVVARWQANLQNDVFHIELQIEEEAPISNPAFYIAISQCVLYIGG
ncbi:tubby C-terminal domain-like protein [Rummeliibacillus pycnus]|uniref:tubby C-terminal domain-like protein n=1 Tax=Rummeliibacillus pycnus TaxID=101070 RepID=UPI003D28B011